MGNRENFGSRRAVIYAMAGSAIGLGNIWRFPYMAGEHGGAVFVISYIVATLLVSLPVFIAEVTIGRRSRTSSYTAMRRLDPAHKAWRWAGLLSIFIPMVILCYYSVIGGWSLFYLFKACAFDFVGTSPEAAESLFGGFISSTWTPIGMHLVFMAVCAWVVARGVKSGIERFSKLTIPALFVLVVLMIAYSLSLPGASQGVRYLWHPDASALNVKTFVYAMGQSFFSLSLGMGAIITYGSYVKSEENLVVSSAGRLCGRDQAGRRSGPDFPGDSLHLFQLGRPSARREFHRGDPLLPGRRRGGDDLRHLSDRSGRGLPG